MEMYHDGLHLTRNHEVIKGFNNEGEIETEIVEPDLILFHLDESISLDEGFTLRDYFEIVDKYYPLKLIDGFFSCFIKEFRNCPKEGCVDFEEEIDYLLFNRYASYECSKTIRPSIDLGFESESDSDNNDLQFNAEIETSIDFHAYSEKTNTTYGIDFMPLEYLLDHEIKFGNSRISIELEGNYEDYENMQDKFIYREAPDVGYTLYEFIKNIIWELSFYGCSENREEQKEILRQRANDVDENYIKVSKNDSDED